MYAPRVHNIHSRNLAILRHLQPVESSQHSPTMFPKINLILSSQLRPVFPRDLFPYGLSTKILCARLPPPPCGCLLLQSHPPWFHYVIIACKAMNTNYVSPCLTFRSRDRSFGIATGYGLEGGGLIPGWWQILLYTTTSRPALVLTQPPVQSIPGAVFQEVKWPGREADNPPPSSAEIKNGELFLHSPIRFHGVAIN
jgi:hypothetical protein